MNGFAEKIRKTINGHSLLRKTGRVIVAVSGGADSVALLSVLIELGYDCVAAHCNFHLRGEESNRDMRFVEALTERLNVDLYLKEFNVTERIATTGESIEMACRALRYEWFFDLLDRDSAQAIAVGHHREDQAETFFLNLFRGSGLTGLAGMRYRADHVVRPMLDCTRSEIERYLKARHLEWITDSTNESNDFMRNRLRNHLLPMMEELFPGACNSIIRSMGILRENESVYSALIRDRARLYSGSEPGEFDIVRMIEAEPHPDILLFEILKSEGFNRTQASDMIEAAKRGGGSFRAGATHIRNIDHGMLRAPHAGLPEGHDSYEAVMTRDIFEPVRIQITRHNVAEFRPERNPTVSYIDACATEGVHQWRIRHWQRGDRMTPYGMKGSKLLSDIFADAKLSAKQKADAWLLTRDDEIIWVIGIRTSAHFTIGPSTHSFLRLELIQ